jgi:hypothetical protein
MKKTAPVKESGLEVLHGHSIKFSHSSEGATLAPTHSRMYRYPVAANSATRFDGLMKLAHKRPKSIERRFFSLPTMFYGGCAWEGFGPAGCQLSRSVNLRTAATLNRLTAIDGSSTNQVGATLMKTVRTIRAAAHRRMAIAALHADTSLKTRLTRYQQHMTKARALEGGAV